MNPEEEAPKPFSPSRAIPARRSEKTEALFKEAAALGIPTRGRFAADVRKEVSAVKENIEMIDRMAEAIMMRKTGDTEGRRPSAELSGHSIVMPSSSLQSTAPQKTSRPSEGGAAPQQAPPLAFQLADASDQNGPKLRIISGFVANKIPPGMTSGDNPPYIVSVSGPGSAYVGVVISIATGEVTSVMIGVGSIPSDTSTNHYYSLGSFSVVGGAVSVSSNRGGNVGVSVCRKWYVGEKEKGYNVIFSQ